jgi:hypothetical protein
MRPEKGHFRAIADSEHGFNTRSALVVRMSLEEQTFY